MKRVLMHLWVVSALLVLSVGTAGAVNTLHITGWMVGGGGLRVWADVGAGTMSGTYGAGAFSWQLDGVSMTTPLYCLDLFHTFHFGDTWEVEPIVIPPDPPDPPPYNTGEAVWVYNSYGHTDIGAVAQGVQLALWEISHDPNWRDHYGAYSGHWWSTGTFKYTGPLSNAGYQSADNILEDVYDNYDPGQSGWAIYYQPHPYHQNQYYGQGQMGGIPEPGTLILLGMGVLSFAGVAWRKRKQ